MAMRIGKATKIFRPTSPCFPYSLLPQRVSTEHFGEEGNPHLGEEIEIEVRWPSGEVTRHRKKIDGTYVEIGQYAEGVDKE